MYNTHMTFLVFGERQ
ncbi:hypothetical protein DOY81_004232 [Sarcophaga bullata]|nr:hypothetical protein DOY81_004232 [Sarcophaga bullata]